MMEMSLEELLSVKVSIASHHDEDITETPAIVSTYTTKDMQLMGLNRLEEILGFIPGFTIKEGVDGKSLVMIRGISQYTNQKVLFLIDGVPYWDAAHGDIPILGLPISAIERIEVIRGPGTIHYGTNASTGVIKVTTKKASGKNSIASKFGSNDLQHHSIQLSHRIHDDFNILATAEFMDDSGYDGTYSDLYVTDFSFDGVNRLFPADTPNSTAVKRDQQLKTGLLKINYHDFKILLQKHSAQTAGISGFLTAYNHAEVKSEGELAHIEYNKQIDNGELNVFADHNRYLSQDEVKNSLGLGTGVVLFKYDDNSDVYRRRIGSTYSKAITENTSLFVGGEYEERSTSARFFEVPDAALVETFFDKDRAYESSLYTQLDYHRNAWRFLLGLRRTRNSISGSETTPRVSAVYKINDASSFKLMHSIGFNVPNFTQRQISNFNNTISTPDTKPEKIKSTDFAYSYSNNNSLFVANFYYFESKDLIQNVYTPDIDININFDIRRYGAEFDFQKVIKKWKLFTNLSYHHQGNRRVGDDLVVDSSAAPPTLVSIGDFVAFVAPRITYNLGVVKRIKLHHSIGGSWRYVSELGDVDATYNINLSYHYDNHDWIFFCSIKNLLDEEISHPDDSSPPINVPGGDKLNFLVGGKIYF